jgi:hypothetical protein
MSISRLTAHREYIVKRYKGIRSMCNIPLCLPCPEQARGRQQRGSRSKTLTPYFQRKLSILGSGNPQQQQKSGAVVMYQTSVKRENHLEVLSYPRHLRRRQCPNAGAVSCYLYWLTILYIINRRSALQEDAALVAGQTCVYIISWRFS